MRKITAIEPPEEIASRGEGGSRAYIKDLAGAKTGASVKPVIIPQFVDLDTFATVGRLKLQRHDPGSKDQELSRLSTRWGVEGVGRPRGWVRTGDVMGRVWRGENDGREGDGLEGEAPLVLQQ